MQRIDGAQRRARLGVRHQLATAAAGPVEVARAMVALHSTDPGSVFLSVLARTAQVDVQTVERALYQDRTLIRMLGMRRTMFVVPVELAPVIQAACANAIADTQRRVYVKFLDELGIGDGEWFRDVQDSTERALLKRGEAVATQLSEDEPRLRTPVVVAAGKPYQTKQNITSWVLFMLAAEGRIVRGRPRGSWTSSQWSWSPVQAWLPGGIGQLPVEEARVELVRRWLATFGPGTVADLRWWTGWTTGQVKQALAELKPVEVDLDEGGTGLVLPDDVEPVPEPDPWVALLPALDPTPMGWSQRAWYLGEHAPQLFDRSGNVAPTVWADGRIIGGWTQRPDGEVVYRLLEDVGADTTAEVAAAAQRLAAWIGPARIAPRTRLRPPLERELLG
ncbi:MAG: winged helix DNA-binding domain-containing protein [Sporichthyaceae bacterium]|nr:winged helix DNA-binding domain-containing protein [Sporichthyaceae bacterium]